MEQFLKGETETKNELVSKNAKTHNILTIFQEVAELSKVVNNTLSDMVTVNSQVKNLFYEPYEVDQSIQKIKCGQENVKSFAEFITNCKDTINSLESFTGCDFDNIDLDYFYKSLNDIKEYRQEHLEKVKQFKILSFGLKKVHELVDSETPLDETDTPQSKNTDSTFSDIFYKSCKLATSSPFCSF